jgi:glutamate formiminotransferase / formiminotetrahydrofolate cyclodeaminase
MIFMDKIVECVPNISEGRDKNKINEVISVVKEIKGVTLLDVDPGAETNRTVITIIGDPENIQEAAFQLVKKASEVIDMSNHKGAHPRMGATDVCPFVPVSGVTMEDCIEIAKKVGKRIGDELEIPIYLYENAASKPEWQNLAEVRVGEYEALEEKLAKPEWKPDFGHAKFNPKAGATAVGARNFLIAYNIDLNTRDPKLAKEIAYEIREKGRAKRDKNGKRMRDENGNLIRRPGKYHLNNCKATGWYIPEFGYAQVTMNLTNIEETSVHHAFDASKGMADELGIRLTGSEIVGLVPKKAMIEAGLHYLKKAGQSTGVPEKELIHIAIESLGLNHTTKFDPEEKIIEYRVQKTGPLASMTVKDFAEEVSMDSVAPGGGSVSALSGGLCAALSGMIGNLTIGKKGYEEHYQDLDKMAFESQERLAKLIKGVDEDTDAFNDVIAAKRLPKATKEEKEAREKAIEDGYKKAIEVPLQTAINSLESMKLSKIAIQKGNVNSASDAGVAALCGYTGVIGGIMNCKINFNEISDREYINNMKKKFEGMIKEAEQIRDEVLKMVNDLIEKNS